MKILITGTEGYLGSLLAPILIQQGHELLAVDTGYYRTGWLYHGSLVSPETLNKDIRHITAADLDGAKAVVHMAELSNDPTGELAPQITYQINHQGSVRLAGLAKQAGVKRFVYMSSCSVYGFASEEHVTEESPVNPQTAYAICKTLVERDLKAMADDNFSPTFLRNATAYGASPRMRFDIVLNNLAGLAWTTKEIKMISDGTPWRPLVHALDIAQAIVAALDAPRDAVHNQIFNVGESAHNYTVKEIAQVVADAFPGCRLSFGQKSSDHRSYRVSFDKIKGRLPGFKCRWDARRGAEQLRALFQQVDLTPDAFNGRAFTRLKQLEYLIRTHQIDGDFFWRDAQSPELKSGPAK
ncbi:MAG: NAD-dependent epimerase/dehydratase family protein [Chthoniobacterales bacterium]